MGKWYAGVVHSHTTRSDGIFSPDELVKKAAKKGLDFLIITDHNQFCDPVPASDKILVIPGTELTKDGGHTNIWGLTHPIDNFDCDTYDDWNAKIKSAKEAGATVCINHPLCSQCGWRWETLEPEKADCIEIWNSPQHTDNMRCTAWWQDELRKGKKIPVVGGSDFHRDYFVTDFLANPTSYVYAEECTQEAILSAIRAGHVTISPNVGKTMIEITSGDKMMGDTVKLSENSTVLVKVNNLKKGHTLKVIDNEGIKFEFKSRKSGAYSVTLPIDKPGFICAQIEYDMNPLIAPIFIEVDKKISHNENLTELPAFVYAQTNAIYFED